MIIVTTILFFINIIFNYLIKLFIWNAFITKVILVCIMLYILQKLYYYPRKQRSRLSSLRKLRLEFPYAYIFKNNVDQVKSVVICFTYIGIFVVGILILRISSINRVIDLKIYYNLLVMVLQNSTYVDIILNICIIIIGTLIYRYIMKYIQKWFKFHRIKIHLYLVKFEHSYIYILDKSSKYHIGSYYSPLVKTIQYVLYYTGLKKLNKRSTSLSWDIQRKENSTAFESFFLGYLIPQNYKIHYHILFIIFIMELLYNNFVLAHIYIVLPFVFLYEIWVRFSKTIDVKNITYDIALHHMIHIPITHMDEFSLEFDTGISARIYEKAYLRDIVKNYVRNDFRDKDMEDLYKKIARNYHILSYLKNSIYFVYLVVFILCHYI